MPTSCAFIGHQPHLSIAELAAVIPGFRMINIFDRSAVLFEHSEPLAPGLLDKLGGTMVLSEGIEGATLEGIPVIFEKHLRALKGKVTFSLRTIGLPKPEVRELYRKSKDHLKKAGKSSRYVGSDQSAAPAVVLHTEKLLDGTGGIEVAVVRDGDTLWIGKTVGAHDIEAYTHRDIKKPVRDTTVGLLPPKLAQILLNFGVWAAGGEPVKDAKKGKKEPVSQFTVYDPFCGTGVIPMECLLRGFAVLASDKSEKAVTGCQTNLEWLRKQKKILKTDLPSQVWKQDALKPFGLKAAPQVIVTETTLGPSLKTRATAKEAISHRSESEDIEQGFLENVKKELPGVPVICTWPVWYTAKKPLRLERIWKTIEKLGYKAVLPPGISATDGIPSLLYRRPDQLVGREIVILKPAA